MTASIPEAQTEKTPSKAKKKASVAKRRAHPAPPKANQARKAASAKKPATARHGTAKVLELLKRPTGVTLKELMKVTGWQAHSVCGLLSGTVIKGWGFPLNPL